ncbi:hypothetical protein WA026_001107 [Henosepilachna vigintioctopunctata]|uniref:Uncharacterized protein n=1 Tax=Henosepilachna vigintioctopunctata TaxID=420089 RepID=A0AAW1V9G8_9CUCU
MGSYASNNAMSYLTPARKQFSDQLIFDFNDYDVKVQDLNLFGNKIQNSTVSSRQDLDTRLELSVWTCARWIEKVEKVGIRIIMVFPHSGLSVKKFKFFIVKRDDNQY